MEYKIDFEPIAKVDENILLIPEKKPYKVVYVEPLPIIPHDFGSISITSPTKVSQTVDDLEMPGNELAQLRFAPVDDVYITINQPKAVGRFLTKSYQVKIGPEIWVLNPSLSRTEIFQFEDRSLEFTLSIITKYDQPRSLVIFQGFRYILEPLAKMPEKWTAVPISGKAPAGGA